MLRLRSIARRVIRRGSRTAVLIPDWAGFGNQLFYYFHVDRLQRAGVRALAVPNDSGRTWLREFPAIRDSLICAKSDVRFFDRIDATDWDAMGRFGVDYTREDLTLFVKTYLAPAAEAASPDPQENALTINVRRGDYYSNPSVRGVLGFDQPAYISAAMERYTAVRPMPDVINVISDDPTWCSVRLRFLGEYTRRLEFNDRDSLPMDDFRRVAHAENLIITNSTFSVWAAHIAGIRTRDAFVIAPAFGTRPHHGRWAPLDPEWAIIENIPGGWDS